MTTSVYVLMINDTVVGVVDSEEKKKPFEDKIRAKETQRAYINFGRINHKEVERYMNRMYFHWNTVPFNDIEV